MKYKAVLFDMDGTILDTVKDLRRTLNRILQQNGHPCDYTDDEVKLLFGSGIAVALTRAFAYEHGTPMEEIDQITQTDPKVDVKELADQWKKEYDRHASDHTKPYEGIVELCQKLKEDGVIIGVMSNKPDSAVQQLCRQYFPGLFDLIIGESETIRRKPAPDMIEKAYEQFALRAEEVCYVGDTEIDIQTAEKAGCDVICVTWGFRSTSYLQQYHPSFFAQDTEALKKIIYEG